MIERYASKAAEIRWCRSRWRRSCGHRGSGNVTTTTTHDHNVIIITRSTATTTTTTEETTTTAPIYYYFTQARIILNGKNSFLLSP